MAGTDETRPIDINKVLRMDQEGEHLHQLLYAIETSYKAERYWLMLETYENKLHCTI